MVALAVPHAFGADAVLFGVGYLLVHLLDTALLAIVAGGNRDLRRVLMRIAPSAAIAPFVILAAGVVGGRWQVALWGIALAILYSGPLIGLGRGWRVSATHFAERYGLIVIIALGETIIAIGVGATDVPLTPGPVLAAILGVVVIAALWVGVLRRHRCPCTG